ncbi:MAG: hypothetical protein GQ542_02110 [Desulforhopalus sp.]|nr:hypothetical protein [Desulforhopalus sp.]
MRASTSLLMLLVVFSLLACGLTLKIIAKRSGQEENFQELRKVVFCLGLSDLALSTEARYTRHPATSDPVVVSMDHPGAIDHFPSTFFWAPVR